MRTLASPAVRSILSALRRRPTSLAALGRRLPHLSAATIKQSVALLYQTGALARAVHTTWARLPARGVATYVYRPARPEAP